MKKNLPPIALFLLILFSKLSSAPNKIIVFKSDFGLKDGAVSEMKGVAVGVSPELKLLDINNSNFFTDILLSLTD